MNSNFKRFCAILTIIIILSFYIISLILVLLNKPYATNFLMISILITTFVPLYLYIISLFKRLNNNESSIQDKTK